MINEIWLDNELLTYEPNKIHSNQIRNKNKQIKCKHCLNVFHIKNLDKNYFVKDYFCRNCWRLGSRNPFYGKKHAQESIDKANTSKRKRFQLYGSPLKGRKVDPKTVERVKLSRKRNQEKTSQKHIQKMVERYDFSMMFEEYKNTPINQTKLKQKYRLDFRVMKKYWVKLGLITPEDLKNLTMKKQLDSNPSYPEYELFNILKERYGNSNVVKCFNINGYYFDICLFNRILVEYDGFHWHETVKNPNDKIKNELADKGHFYLCRIKETKNRKHRGNINLILDQLYQYINQFLEKENAQKYKEILMEPSSR